MKKPFILWVLAIVITVAAAYYQRKTGPTYPFTTDLTINGRNLSAALPRSHDVTADCEVAIKVPDGTSGKIVYRKYPTSDNWQEQTMTETEDGLHGFLPAQPAAGKLEYFMVLNYEGNSYNIPENNPVVIRFKGDVPAAILVPHILFMFLAMLFSSLTGLLALAKNPKQKRYGWITLVILFVGGMILGPLVQKHAFDALWTGVPFGWDLTDNKTLIGLVFWIAAVWGNHRKERPGLYVLAAVILLVVFSIPHSMFGSELNYDTGNVIQGLVLPVFLLK